MNQFVLFMRRTIIILAAFFAFACAYSQKPTFNHVAINVSDLNKSSAFYRDIIGLDTMANPFHDNKHVWFVIGDNLQMHMIASAPAASEHPQDNHLCFSVTSVETFSQKLVNAGIVYKNARGIKNEITVRPDGVKQIYFTDPDGFWIEINDAKK